MNVRNSPYHHSSYRPHHLQLTNSDVPSRSMPQIFNRKSSGLSDSTPRSLVGSLRSKMSLSKRASGTPPPPAYSTNPFDDPPAASPATRRPAPPPPGPHDPPPAYSEPMAEMADDPYAFLAKFDTVFLIDDSGSMAGRSWGETAAALATIAPVCAARDRDGVDVHFLNHPRSYTNLTSADAVQRVFASVRPGGGTPTGCRLRDLLKPYVARVEKAQRAEERAAPGAAAAAEVKPMNLIIITDGAASDDVESEVTRIANRLEAADAPAWQVGIQFFQVGCERGAAQALQELDDELVHQGCRRDIVDTVPWKGGPGGECQLSADKILKCVLGAVVRKIDRQRNSADSARSGAARGSELP